MKNTELDEFFPRYLAGPSQAQAPVWCITPQIDRCIHRFYDTSPVSPSGRYVALTRLPYEDRLPVAGDPAEIVLVDLLQGTTQVVAETRGWDSQLGAQAQWGGDDHSLYFNDIDTQTWTPFGVRFDPSTGGSRRLGGSVYTISPDGRTAASPCLRRIARTQLGYGVVVPANYVPKNPMAAGDDGIYLTDTETGLSRLLISFAAIVECLGSTFDLKELGDGSLYGHHVKWNPQGDRLMFVMRWKSDRRRPHPMVITMKPDGTEVTVAVDWKIWRRGGHHPNWCPDGNRILMNLKADGTTMRFVFFDYDGRSREVATEKSLGSGHPTLHPNGRNILSDAYLGESAAAQYGKVPLRWIDIRRNTDELLAWVDARPTSDRLESLRVDPHPAWDRSYRKIVFNGNPEGTRRVYLCDMQNLL